MAPQKRVGVVLAGCGFLDGAEIQEAVCTLLSLDRRGAKLVAAAPDVAQLHVVDHLKGAPVEGSAERARRVGPHRARPDPATSRRCTRTISTRSSSPAASAPRRTSAPSRWTGVPCACCPEVERLVREVRAAGKPMGFICIAPGDRRQGARRGAA